MGDNEVFSNPEESNGQQADGHQERVHSAFGSLQETLAERTSKAEEERVLGIREAIATGDKAKAEEHLTAVKQESSWLYEELMKHPGISAIFRELSIMGF